MLVTPLCVSRTTAPNGTGWLSRLTVSNARTPMRVSKLARTSAPFVGTTLETLFSMSVLLLMVLVSSATRL